MKIIKMLCERIDEEISDARFYAKKALKFKSTYPEVAETFYNLAGQEMEHMKKLHNQVTKIIEAYRESHGDPPVEMQAVYDVLHKRAINNAVTVNSLLQLYKG